jgi:predicted DNA-binding transcriptional regulator AlpA
MLRLIVVVRLLNQREAAVVLRLSERTLERFRLTGGGPVFVKAGRRVLYREPDIEEWIASRTRASTSATRPDVC